MTNNKLIESDNVNHNYNSTKKIEIANQDQLDFLERLSNKQDELLTTNQRINEKADLALEGVKELRRFKDYHVRKVKDAKKKKVNEFLFIYKRSASNILHGRIQGYLFNKYQVNRYEDFFIIHYPLIIEDIKIWTPDSKLYEKLEVYKQKPEDQNKQLDLF